MAVLFFLIFIGHQSGAAEANWLMESLNHYDRVTDFIQHLERISAPDRMAKLQSFRIEGDRIYREVYGTKPLPEFTEIRLHILNGLNSQQQFLQKLVDIFSRPSPWDMGPAVPLARKANDEMKTAATLLHQKAEVARAQKIKAAHTPATDNEKLVAWIQQDQNLMDKNTEIMKEFAAAGKKGDKTAAQRAMIQLSQAQKIYSDHANTLRSLTTTNPMLRQAKNLFEEHSRLYLQSIAALLSPSRGAGQGQQAIRDSYDKFFEGLKLLKDYKPSRAVTSVH